jgi:hypothetical protein
VDDTAVALSKSLQRYQAIVVGGLAFVVMFALTVMGALIFLAFSVGHQAAEVRNVAVTTHTSLCALRHDLAVRLQGNDKLLRDHPEDPIRAYGLEIPRATIIQSRDGQKATLTTLKGLNCE